MEQLTAVWFIIVLALITANLPFALERPLLVLPWAQTDQADQSFWLRWLESLAFFVLLAALAYFVRPIIGTAVFSGSDPVSVLLFLAKLLGVLAVAVLLLSYAGWRRRGHARVSRENRPDASPESAGSSSEPAKSLRKPARSSTGHAKSFFVRLLELLMFYALVGMLGFGFERNMGNPFVQGWQFYAITLTLFVVLGYPGFVYRYLLRSHGRRKA